MSKPQSGAGGGSPKTEERESRHGKDGIGKVERGNGHDRVHRVGGNVPQNDANVTRSHGAYCLNVGRLPNC